MRTRMTFDEVPNDGAPEEWLKAQLEDYQEMTRRYERRLDELKEENEMLRGKVDELKCRTTSDHGNRLARTTIVLNPDKRTRRTIRFEEHRPSKSRTILGKLYVKKWWLDAQGWQNSESLELELGLGNG